MPDVGTFIKNADIQARCGTHANTTAKATAATDVYVIDVEHYINTISRYDWIANFATLGANYKRLLTEAGACICAMYVIQWDMSGFSSLAHAQTMLNVLYDRAKLALDLLSDQNTAKKVQGG